MSGKRQELQGRAFWYGQELARSGDWIRTLGPTATQEIIAALDGVKRRRTPLFEITRDDFPLGRTLDVLAEVAAELEDGRGMVRLRGLPLAGLDEDDLRRLFWGIGTHLGTAVFQNA